jgi:hypothetical protein
MIGEASTVRIISVKRRYNLPMLPTPAMLGYDVLMRLPAHVRDATLAAWNALAQLDDLEDVAIAVACLMARVELKRRLSEGGRVH